jgi:hypothetical protein
LPARAGRGRPTGPVPHTSRSSLQRLVPGHFAHPRRTADSLPRVACMACFTMPLTRFAKAVELLTKRSWVVDCPPGPGAAERDL